MYMVYCLHVHSMHGITYAAAKLLATYCTLLFMHKENTMCVSASVYVPVCVYI